MTLSLKTTPAREDSNSYISLTKTESYFSDFSRLGDNSTWPLLSDNQKILALHLSTRLLDSFAFKGQKVTATQKLAFPRFTWYQLNVENIKQYRNFFWATRGNELESIVSSGDIKVLNNKLIDTSSSSDAFYSPHYNGYIENNQVIKQSGLSAETYLTIDYIANDGSEITIKEDINDENVPSDGVDINATLLFGYPEEVGWAQAEIAFQIINLSMFQADIQEPPERLIRSYDLGGSLEVRYQNEMRKESRLGKDRFTTSDIVYLHLNHWLGIEGKVV